MARTAFRGYAWKRCLKLVRKDLALLDNICRRHWLDANEVEAVLSARRQGYHSILWNAYLEHVQRRAFELWTE